jgi:outer membrane protein OmpA-like peptidoglycan-associated protein
MVVSPLVYQPAPSQASSSVVAEVVNVDFTSATTSGSAIVNSAPDAIANLTPVGSPAGLGTTDGLVFANTSSPTGQYLTGNIGATTNMSQIVVEIVAKFPDTGCSAQASGSMVFGLGTSSSSYVQYNIYRHSNFIGFNTFTSDLYGISIPNTTDFYSYKFVMVPSTQGFTAQEIWIAPVGEALVKQSLSYKTTSSAVSPCSTITGTGETTLRRVFTGGVGSFSNGNFALMTHPVGATTWGTTGSVRSVKITTTTALSAPSAPTITSVTAGNSELSVAFTSPTSNGGASITNYDYSTDNGSTWTTLGTPSTTSPIVIPGLSNGTSYQVRLRARNSEGAGTASAAVSGTPTFVASLPGVPSISSISAGDSQLSVAFTAPGSDGGATITNYDYSLDNGSNWVTPSTPSTSSPLVITGLANGTTYQVKLRARNSVGPGSGSIAVSGTPIQPSPASSSQPAMPPTPPSAEVAGLTIRSGNTSNSSVVRVRLTQPPRSGEQLTVIVRLLDSVGKILQELKVNVDGTTGAVDVPVNRAIGRFTAVALTSNQQVATEPIALSPEVVRSSTTRIIEGTGEKRLAGRPISESLVFSPNSTQLSKEVREALKIAAKVAKSRNQRVAVTGFAAVSSQGSRFERLIAERRALAVAEFLRKRGVQSWILFQGFSGLESLEFPGEPRRVEIRVLK